ncbi:MAG: glycosyl hydrolase 2 galactose-binding domain-containing protein, partial [Candidatus Helarchaeota archaeon]
MRKNINLNECNWRLAISDKNSSIKTYRDLKNSKWIEASVPGNVQLDLLNAGLIEDPFVEDNYRKIKWIEEKTWWYEATFPFSKSEKNGCIQLNFKGVDYLARFWLNEKLLGNHVGMFSHVSFDVTDQIQDHNRLLVQILPPPKNRVQGIKCQMSYGWDFAPRIVTMGIWDDVFLARTGKIFLSDYFLQSKFDSQKPTHILKITVQNRQDEIQDIELEASLSSNEIFNDSYQVVPGENKIEMQIGELDLKRWNPWDLGEPYLHPLCLKLFNKGELQDQIEGRFGIRDFVVKRPNYFKK